MRPADDRSASLTEGAPEHALDAVEAFQALRDPIRRRLLEALPAHGELSRDLLLRSAVISTASASRHLTVLVRARLVTVRKVGRTLHYSLRRESFHALEFALADLARPARAG